MLRVIVWLNTGFTRPMQTSKKFGALYTVELNLLWCVYLSFVHGSWMDKAGKPCVRRGGRCSHVL